MSNHRQLEVWQRAHALAAEIDIETRRMARGNAELGDQLHRASLSIASNLAEGAARGRDGEFLRYISIAIGSAGETDSLIAHAEATGALDPSRCATLCADLTIVRKMLFKLRTAIQRRPGSERTEPSADR